MAVRKLVTDTEQYKNIRRVLLDALVNGIDSRVRLQDF